MGQPEVSQWTRDWWDILPEAYKTLDKVQNPEIGGYPLMRWMEGIGSIAGDFRKISDDLYDGVYTDPKRAPEHAVRWLALMLGLPEQVRHLPVEHLRARLQALVTSGRTAVGTSRHITEGLQVIFPGAMTWVRPSKSNAHVLVVYMRAADIPGEDLAAARTAILEAGIIPAGHDVLVQKALSTWDSWYEAAGSTWVEKEDRIRTWTDSDSAGVVQE